MKVEDEMTRNEITLITAGIDRIEKQITDMREEFRDELCRVEESAVSTAILKVQKWVLISVVAAGFSLFLALV